MVLDWVGGEKGVVVVPAIGARFTFVHDEAEPEIQTHRFLFSSDVAATTALNITWTGQSQSRQPASPSDL